MKLAHLRGKIGAALLGIALLVGIGAASGTANAQYRNPYDQGRRGGYGRDIYRIAEQQGFRDGQWEGSNRARDRKSYDPYGTRSYKKATDGYNSYMGDKRAYQDAYRQAYLRGYNEGYRQYDRGRGGRRY